MNIWAAGIALNGEPADERGQDKLAVGNVLVEFALNDVLEAVATRSIPVDSPSLRPAF